MLLPKRRVFSESLFHIQCRKCMETETVESTSSNCFRPFFQSEPKHKMFEGNRFVQSRLAEKKPLLFPLRAELLMADPCEPTTIIQTSPLSGPLEMFTSASAGGICVTFSVLFVKEKISFFSAQSCSRALTTNLSFEYKETHCTSQHLPIIISKCGKKKNCFAKPDPD